MRKLLIIFGILLSFTLNAQKPPLKYGKVSKDELNMERCDFHPEAYSMILYNYGNLSFKYNNEKGWQYRMQVIVRKKVFNKLDKDAGNIKIKVYDPVKGENREKVGALKACTFNLVDGKIQKTKLDKDSKFEKRINDYWTEISFAMPDVREGSVIDYKYEVVSDFLYNLKTWYFQDDVPVGHSEFRCILPEFFNYQVNQVGNVIPLETAYDNKQESFTYQWKSSPQQGGKVYKGTNSLASVSQMKLFIGSNIPPVVDEPFMNNKCDVPSRLEFQLVSVQMPDRPIEMIAEDYNHFSKELMEMNSFGHRLTKGRFSKRWATDLEGKDELQRAATIYQISQNHFAWNGVYSFLSSEAGSTIFDEKNGDVADINLSFIAALKEHGINASPLILSTRGHGTVHPLYPSFDDFNYVVAYIQIGQEYYLADATSETPFGVLPKRCLNGNGWLVKKQGGVWVDLKQSAKHNSTVLIQLSLDNENMACQISSKQEGYAALEVENSYQKEGLESLKDEITKGFEDWEIQGFEYDSSNNVELVKLSFELNQQLAGEDIIYLQPMSYGASKKNPFVREERSSTIDFPYGYNEKVYAQIKVPEGYTAEVPETFAAQLPEKAGSFRYIVTQSGNNISVLSDMKLVKKDFSPTEYELLKQFFELVSEKNNQFVVLKKI